jgi:sigma54-dependent transcription regulator
MPPITQDRLIETLAELQDARDPSVAVRLMAGTTVSLSERIADGTFSEGLFYRLNIIHVVMKVAAPGNGSAQEAARPTCLEAPRAQLPREQYMRAAGAH